MNAATVHIFDRHNQIRLLEIALFTEKQSKCDTGLVEAANTHLHLGMVYEDLEHTLVLNHEKLTWSETIEAKIWSDVNADRKSNGCIREARTVALKNCLAIHRSITTR